MQRDGLLRTGSADLTGRYLKELTEVLQGSSSLLRLIECASGADLPGSREVRQYVETRLRLLRADDLDEWAYTLAVALRATEGSSSQTLSQLSRQTLQALSPWPEAKLTYLKYGHGFISQLVATPDFNFLDEEALRTASEQAIAQVRYRRHDCDSYLIVIDEDEASVYWLDCGRRGVTGPRPPV